MKYNYEFLDETVEVEVSKEWMEVLLELDKREYNNDHAETRRHISLDMFDDRSEVLISQDPELPDLMILKEDEQRIMHAIAFLNQTQQEVINEICLYGMSISDLAVSKGITPDAVYKRLKSAKKSLKNFL